MILLLVIKQMMFRQPYISLEKTKSKNDTVTLKSTSSLDARSFCAQRFRTYHTTIYNPTSLYSSVDLTYKKLLQEHFSTYPLTEKKIMKTLMST